jgi:formylglycine-generating enzyme required for sulfatase activity
VSIWFVACGGGDGGGDGGAIDGGVDCPADMLASDTVCIDRYEASHGNADVAESVASAPPWVSVAWGEANAACEAAGKRLCYEDEWRSACRGTAGFDFPYGDTYDADACNGADQSNTTAQPTGSMATCEGGRSGLFDMSGNVAEWTQTCSGSNCRQVGGSFASAAANLECTSGSMSAKGSTGLVLGFRCCLTP